MDIERVFIRVTYWLWSHNPTLAIYERKSKNLVVSQFLGLAVSAGLQYTQNPKYLGSNAS